LSDKNIGIRDVALAAGVSVTTVSHVLNDVSYARVSAETRKKVRAAAEELGYGPDRLAQALRTRRTGLLGFVSEDIATTPHAGRIILGADGAARARGYNLMIISTSASASTASREADVDALLERRVDGILYATMYHRKVDAPANLGKVPAILVDAVSTREAFPSVVPDEHGGARTAVEALLTAGHTRIGFLNNTADVPSTHLRRRGFRDTLAAAGLDGERAPVEIDSSDANGGYQAARRMLQASRPPSGIFCYNDRMAMGAYRAAAELGLSIPADLSVVGFDDQELIAGSLHPGLTTVALPHFEMGAWAADTLINAIEGSAALPGPKPSPTLLDCPLVVRGSVAAPGQGPLRPEGTFEPYHA